MREKSNRTLGENKPNLHFTAENAEYAEKKNICEWSKKNWLYQKTVWDIVYNGRRSWVLKYWVRCPMCSKYPWKVTGVLTWTDLSNTGLLRWLSYWLLSQSSLSWWGSWCPHCKRSGPRLSAQRVEPIWRPVLRQAWCMRWTGTANFPLAIWSLGVR